MRINIKPEVSTDERPTKSFYKNHGYARLK